MLRIRLQRVGSRNQPHFRIVVADRRAAAKKGAIAVIGQYRPDRQPKLLIVDRDQTATWLKHGAKPSDTVHNLLVDQGILKNKRNIKYAREKPVEEVAAAPSAKPADEGAAAPSNEPSVDPTPAEEEKSN